MKNKTGSQDRSGPSHQARREVAAAWSDCRPGRRAVDDRRRPQRHRTRRSRDGEGQLHPLPPVRDGANLNTAAFDKRGVLWVTGPPMRLTSPILDGGPA